MNATPPSPLEVISNQITNEHPNQPIMSPIVWNCRGSQNAEFRRQYRSLLDNHRPVLVVLLETHMQDHTNLRDDFQSTNMSQVSANGLFGGIVILWHRDLVNVDELRMFEQEIHCTVHVWPFTTK